MNFPAPLAKVLTPVKIFFPTEKAFIARCAILPNANFFTKNPPISLKTGIKKPKKNYNCGSSSNSAISVAVSSTWAQATRAIKNIAKNFFILYVITIYF